MVEKKIKVLQWNCNRLKPRLLCFLKIISDFDVLCCQESWLKDEDVLTLPEFNIYRKDRVNEEGGGLFIAIKKNLQFMEILVTERPGIEIQGIKITNIKKNICIFNVYKKPSVYFNESSWTLDLEMILQSSGEILVCGDFNAHSEQWSRNSIQEGKCLAAAVDKTRFMILNNSQQITRLSRPGCISGSPDLTLATPHLAPNSCWNLGEDNLGSDHMPIEITLNNATEKSLTNRSKLSTRKADYNKFRSDLEGNTRLNIQQLASFYPLQDFRKGNKKLSFK